MASAMSSGVGRRRNAVSAAIPSRTAVRRGPLAFGDAGEHRLGVRARDEAGHHHVDPDAVDTHLARQRLRGDGERTLGRRVGALARVDGAHRERGDDHDGAAAGELRDGRPHQLQRPEQVDLPRLLPVVEVGVQDRVVRRALRRAAHHDVEPPEVLDGALHQGAALRDVARVGGHRQCAGTEALDLTHDLGEVVAPAGGDDDVATVAHQREGGRPTDPGPHPGDDGDAPRAGPGLGAHGRAALKSSAMRASRRASSASSSARQPANAVPAACTDAARNRR